MSLSPCCLGKEMLLCNGVQPVTMEEMNVALLFVLGKFVFM